MKVEGKINYICPWETYDKAKSWSGTHLAIFEELKKYYDIFDVNTGYYRNTKTKVLKVVSRALRTINIGDFDTLRIKYINSQIQNGRLLEANSINFQFEETPILSSSKNYYFIDLPVEFVRRGEENNNFSVSSFEHYSKHAIEKRSQDQKKCFENATGIFTMGNWVKKYLVENLNLDPSKIFAVGGGSNAKLDEIDSSKKEGNKILFVGRDFERKNGPLVIDAFKIAQSRRPDIELYIIGPTEKKRYGKNIFELGDVPYAEMSKYYNKCDIFCMPSKYEAFGLVFVEALIYGLPCIGADRFEMPYFIEDGITGYILKDDDASTLADLILKALDNQQLYTNVRNNRKNYIDKYSWESVGKRIHEVIGCSYF